MLTNEERMKVVAGERIDISGSESVEEALQKVINTDTTAENQNLSVGQKKVGAVARLIVLLVSIINQLAVTLGVYTIPNMDESAIKLVSMALVTIAAVWSYWKNNSWTTDAKVADQVLKALQDGDLSITDILTILAEVSGKKNL